MTSKQIDEMERLWKEGVVASEIAKRVGCSHYYVKLIATRDRRRFPRRVMKSPSKEAKELWVSLVLAGRMSARQVADKTGYHPSTVNKWVREAKREQDRRG